MATEMLRDKINILNNELNSFKQQLFQLEVAIADGEGLPEDSSVADRIRTEVSNARLGAEYFRHKIMTRERLLKPLKQELDEQEASTRAQENT